MTGPKGALSVRVSDGYTDQHVTASVSGLRWVKMVNAGHQSLSFRMTLPHNTFGDLGPQDRAWVYDTRTGRCLFDSYVENPTPVDGLGGQAFDMSCVGGVALANDEARPLIYVDQDLGGWAKDLFALEAGSVDAGTWATDETSKRLRVSIPGGGVVATGAFTGADYRGFVDAGMNLGALTAFVVSGRDDADYKVALVHPGGTVDLTNPMSDTGVGFHLYCDDDFPSPTDYFSLRLIRTGGATNVADDTTWTDFVNLIVCGQRVDRSGDLLLGLAGMVTDGTVLASQVVEDLLGRLLTFCDPATALVDTTTWPIDQLAFPDGVKAADVLTSLSLWESDYWWGVGAAGANGLHEFTYRRWATEPRYVVSVKDGYRQTGSDVDLCNRVLVSWTDATGKAQTTAVTAADLIADGLIDASAVAALGSRVKDAEPITLRDGFGSAGNATQIGKAALLDKIDPPRAGTVTVRRPIVDRLTGNTVMPWELEPGWPVLVQEPGHTIRCTQVEYDDESVSAVLTLGTPPLTTEQRQARMSRAA